MTVYVHCDRCGRSIEYPPDVDGAPMPMLRLTIIELPNGHASFPSMRDVFAGVNGSHLCSECCGDLKDWIKKGLNG